MLSKAATSILNDMKKQGSFEKTIVANFITASAKTLGDIATDQHLISCAEEIKAAAAHFILLLEANAEEQKSSVA